MHNKVFFALAILSLIVLVQSSSAVILNSVESPTLAPGGEGRISIELENTLEERATDVSLVLQFTNTPFIPIGTSEQSIDEIDEDDEEIFTYSIKASANAAPGDYQIPYTLSYTFDNDEITRSGSIGISIAADPDLTFSVSAETPVINRQGIINLRIVNKGFYDARFVSVRILPEGFTVLSDKEIYIGSVDSDDFETATFDVLFTKTNPRFQAIVEYVDFNNQRKIENVNLPLTVYTEERALELGIIQQSSTGFYIIMVIVIIVLFIVWRAIRRRRRMKKSRESNR